MFWLCCKKAQLTVKVVDLSIMDIMDTMDTCGPTIDTQFSFHNSLWADKNFPQKLPN